LGKHNVVGTMMGPLLKLVALSRIHHSARVDIETNSYTIASIKKIRSIIPYLERSKADVFK
jgi:hypothetical protein